MVQKPGSWIKKVGSVIERICKYMGQTRKIIDHVNNVIDVTNINLVESKTFGSLLGATFVLEPRKTS